MLAIYCSLFLKQTLAGCDLCKEILSVSVASSEHCVVQIVLPEYDMVDLSQIASVSDSMGKYQNISRLRYPFFLNDKNKRIYPIHCLGD